MQISRNVSLLSSSSLSCSGDSVKRSDYVLMKRHVSVSSKLWSSCRDKSRYFSDITSTCTL